MVSASIPAKIGDKISKCSEGPILKKFSVAVPLSRHLPRVPHYSVVVNMKFYRHDRDLITDHCNENETC